MKLNRVKFFVIAIIFLTLFAVTIFRVNPVAATSKIKVDEAEEIYKKQCAMCHKPTAEKFFDATKTEEVLVDSVLKGKKAEKPPNMPSFETKGITPEQAKLLVAYMKKLRTPPQ
jgi:mono/diheme cytochrome c family protein